MIVGDLLRLEDLRIEVAWATHELLDREVTGVTSTDLQDPARYLRPGELVLTGLVWWRPEDLATDPAAASQAASRFATALRSARAAALLAGEGTHGAVPPELAEACRRHGIPLLAVPAGTSFRAVTDRVYLRLWGDLQHQAEDAAALPAAVRRELVTLLHGGASPSQLLTRAVSDLGLPECSLLTTGGRVLGTSARQAVPEAGSGLAPAGAGPADRPGPPGPTGPTGPTVESAPTARALPVGEPGTTPFDGWLLQPHAEPAAGASAVLRGLADLLAPLADRARSTATAQRQGAARVVDLMRGAGARTADRPGLGPGAGHGADSELAEALRSCGLPTGSPLTPVLVRTSAGPSAWAAAALAEALQQTDAPFVVAPDPGGTSDPNDPAGPNTTGPNHAAGQASGHATGICAASEAEVLHALEEAWPRLGAALVRQGTNGDLTAAVGPCSPPALSALRTALVRTEWTLASAPDDGVVSSAALDSLAALLLGVPAEVRAAYRERLLGPLLAHDRINGVSLLETLTVFLDLDGSWSRAARALHVHVNTVHYRVRRIEELTGRSLARLQDRADLRAALLCAPLFN